MYPRMKDSTESRRCIPVFAPEAADAQVKALPRWPGSRRPGCHSVGNSCSSRGPSRTAPAPGACGPAATTSQVSPASGPADWHPHKPSARPALCRKVSLGGTPLADREVMETRSAALGGGQLRRRRTDLAGRQGLEGSTAAERPSAGPPSLTGLAKSSACTG